MYRAKYRGINKIQTQAYMASYIINLKRLISYIFILCYLSGMLNMFCHFFR